MHIFFIEGFLSGLLVSMPLGAIGMLCLRYILTQGRKSGFAAGLGIAMADALAACIGVLGLTAITAFLQKNEVWTNCIGSIILICFGTYLIFSGKKKTAKKIEKGFAHIVFVMFIITLTSPLTLMSFTGIFASIGFDSPENNLLSVFFLILGVFLGSLSWWVILILISSFFKINEKFAQIINDIAGSLLIIIGAFSLGTLFYNLIA